MSGNKTVLPIYAIVGTIPVSARRVGDNEVLVEAWDAAEGYMKSSPQFAPQILGGQGPDGDDADVQIVSRDQYVSRLQELMEVRNGGKNGGGNGGKAASLVARGEALAKAVVDDRQMSLFGGNPAAKAPGGYEPVPRSKHGGFRKRTAMGYSYWYPDKGEAPAPHPADRAMHHRAMAEHHREKEREHRWAEKQVKQPARKYRETDDAGMIEVARHRKKDAHGLAADIHAGAANLHDWAVAALEHHAVKTAGKGIDPDEASKKAEEWGERAHAASEKANQPEKPKRAKAKPPESADAREIREMREGAKSHEEHVARANELHEISQRFSGTDDKEAKHHYALHSAAQEHRVAAERSEGEGAGTYDAHSHSRDAQKYEQRPEVQAALRVAQRTAKIAPKPAADPRFKTITGDPYGGKVRVGVSPGQEYYQYSKDAFVGKPPDRQLYDRMIAAIKLEDVIDDMQIAHAEMGQRPPAIHPRVREEEKRALEHGVGRHNYDRYAAMGSALLLHLYDQGYNGGLTDLPYDEAVKIMKSSKGETMDKAEDLTARAERLVKTMISKQGRELHFSDVEDKIRSSGGADDPGSVAAKVYRRAGGVPGKSSRTSDELKKEREQPAQDMSKAGEGARGGKVIGHTAGGKPIYASKHLKRMSGVGGTHGIFHSNIDVHHHATHSAVVRQMTDERNRSSQYGVETHKNGKHEDKAVAAAKDPAAGHMTKSESTASIVAAYTDGFSSDGTLPFNLREQPNRDLVKGLMEATMCGEPVPGTFSDEALAETIRSVAMGTDEGNDDNAMESGTDPIEDFQRQLTMPPNVAPGIPVFQYSSGIAVELPGASNPIDDWNR